MSWLVHRICPLCGRKFSFRAPPIDQHLCDECDDRPRSYHTFVPHQKTV